MYAVMSFLACLVDFSRAGELVGGLFPAPKFFFRSFISAVSEVTKEKSSRVVEISVRSVTGGLVVTAVDEEVAEIETDVVSSSILVVY